jgi:hypothetical protein
MHNMWELVAAFVICAPRHVQHIVRKNKSCINHGPEETTCEGNIKMVLKEMRFEALTEVHVV